ncbi:hypothetical protein EVG20_g6742 [Dentipellis fragilis]|uniref:Uncharacterized protein n=1 Tax=Dentipellis fragilis TaxID=205917 RepID=A0A4Y9YIH3_9AGAM|nr:hypothetical protein EVG20_g6742 [Dentipellis fragilis]
MGELSFTSTPVRIRPRRETSMPTPAQCSASAELRVEVPDEYLDFLRGLGAMDIIEHRRKEWLAAATAHGDLDRYVGVIPILCVYLQETTAEAFPVFKQDLYMQELVADARPVQGYDRWFPTLQAMVLRGHMMGPSEMRGDPDLDVRIGRMVKTGSVWRWSPMGDEESLQLGYPFLPGVISQP